MENLRDINKDYQDGFDVETQVSWDSNELDIYIGDRHSVSVTNIDKASACKLAEVLLHKWDFSYFLEFENEEQAYQFIK